MGITNLGKCRAFLYKNKCVNLLVHETKTKMKELKKLRKKLAKKSIAYIKTHEGTNNKEQRKALAEVINIRVRIEFIEACNTMSEVVRGSCVTFTDFQSSIVGRYCKDELDVVFKPLCDPKDYETNKHLLEKVESIDISSVQYLLKCGGNIQRSIDSVTQLKKISKNNRIGITSLIKLMNELRSVLFILEK